MAEAVYINNKEIIKINTQQSLGTQQRSWLRRYATTWKVTGSIPDEVIGFFN
jgi:hypothetical protein